MASSDGSPDPISLDTQALEIRFAANEVRLSMRGWVIAGIVIAAAFWLIPLGWQAVEPLQRADDYRISYPLGNDYWHYARTCREVCRDRATLLVGDSVLWGHYVGSQHTLSHYLNERASERHFENLAVDGIHSVALSGLMRYYGRAIHGRKVIVNCNLLWMSSPRHDLSSDKEAPFNHPGLVPQFRPWIPSYKASLSERIGVMVAHHVDMLGWADHVRIAYFGGDGLFAWSIEHPSRNPLQQITWALPSPDEPPSPMPDDRPWSEKGIRPVTPQWVPLDGSLQWRFFRETVALLQQRDNEVFVLINPLNEHMLTRAGLAGYNARKQQIVAWHRAQAISCWAPPALASQKYADLSHPTAEGYEELAEQLLQQEVFRSFLEL